MRGSLLIFGTIALLSGVPSLLEPLTRVTYFDRDRWSRAGVPELDPAKLPTFGVIRMSFIPLVPTDAVPWLIATQRGDVTLVLHGRELSRRLADKEWKALTRVEEDFDKPVVDATPPDPNVLACHTSIVRLEVADRTGIRIGGASSGCTTSTAVSERYEEALKLAVEIARKFPECSNVPSPESARLQPTALAGCFERD